MKIMIIGCGRMGAGLALHLIQSGHTVTVLDNDPTAFERLEPGFSGKTIRADALDREALVSGEIAGTDALACLTPDDSINLVVARLAREMFRVPNVIARMHDPKKSEIYRRLGIQTISTVTLGMQRLLEMLTFSQLDIVHPLGSGTIGLVESEIPPLLDGRKVDELCIPGEIQVVAISRGGQTFIPILGTVFRKGDRAHIAVSTAATGRLRTMMGID